MGEPKRIGDPPPRTCCHVSVQAEGWAKMELISMGEDHREGERDLAHHQRKAEQQLSNVNNTSIDAES